MFSGPNRGPRRIGDLLARVNRSLFSFPIGTAAFGRRPLARVNRSSLVCLQNHTRNQREDPTKKWGSEKSGGGEITPNRLMRRANP